MSTIMYQLTTSTSIIRLSDNAFIPAAPGNRDYADFLAWKAEGNTPLPAPAPAPPGPDYIAFWDALTTSTIYTAIREQSFTSLPMNTLATELIALLGDAKAGRADEASIQASMAAILDTGTFTAAQLTELQTALVAGHLESIFTLA